MKTFNTIWKLLARYTILFVFILAVLVIIQGMYNLTAVRHNSNDIKGIVKSQSITLDQQQTSLDNQGKIIANLTQAVKDLKKDNKQQTEYIQCLLSLNGKPTANMCVNSQSSSPATHSTSGTPKNQNDIATQQNIKPNKSTSTPPHATSGRTTNQTAPPTLFERINNLIGGIL